MNSLHLLLNTPLFALFAVIGSGLLLGNITVRGISLGTSGVLFTALLCGHFGYALPEGIGEFGVVLFVYCVGIGAGGRFFRSLARDGGTLGQLALCVAGSAGLLCYLFAQLFDLPTALAVGLFSGALTSTPALAAASEIMSAAGDNGVIIGYGIAYPFGIFGVVLFIQVIPHIFKGNLHNGDLNDVIDDKESVQNILVQVTNPNLYRKRISEAGVTKFNACQISRVLDGGQLRPLRYDDTFSEGLLLMLVGKPGEISIAIDCIGERSDDTHIKDIETERRELFVTSEAASGLTLAELAPLKNHGVVISRINRVGITFVPDEKSRLEKYDCITAVGQPEDLNKFAGFIGHRSQLFDATDLVSLSLGLMLGIFVGKIPISLPGGNPITLGLAGGPLLVALVLGHFGRIGRISGHIPRPSRMLLQELGLVLFLAAAGISGGEKLWMTLSEYGFHLFTIGTVITLVPMFSGYLYGRYLLGLSVTQMLGGICGSMTSTPALGTLTTQSHSKTSVVSYATAYPIALILMTVLAKMLIGVLGFTPPS